MMIKLFVHSKDDFGIPKLSWEDIDNIHNWINITQIVNYFKPKEQMIIKSEFGHKDIFGDDKGVNEEILDRETKYIYDTHGNELERIVFSPNSSQSKHMVRKNEYNLNQQLVMSSYYDMINDGLNLLWIQTYEYDRNKLIKFDDKNISEKYHTDESNQFLYDDEFRILEMKTLKGDCRYTYDSKGKLFRISIDNGSSLIMNSFEYDNNGNVIKYDKDITYDGELIKEQNIYTYDSKNNLIYQKSTDPDGFSSISNYEYNEDNLLVEKEYYFKSKFQKTERQFILNIDYESDQIHSGYHEIKNSKKILLTENKMKLVNL